MNAACRVHAILGIGSNSTRMLIVGIGPEGGAVLSRHREDTRLFSGLEKRRLTEGVMLRVVDAVGRLLAEAQRDGAGMTHILATSAMREAENSAELCEIIEALAGCPVRVISGEEEARLSFLGGAGEGYCALLDLGGGSLELAVGGGKNPLRTGSAPLGARRLQGEFPDVSGEGFVRALTVSRERAAALRAAVLSRGEMPDAVYGVGGTLTALAAMDRMLSRFDEQKIEGYALTREKVADWARKLAAMPIEARGQLPGAPPYRAEIVAQGAIALLGAMEAMNIQRISVSARTNLDGYARELAGGNFADPVLAVRAFYDTAAEHE